MISNGFPPSLWESLGGLHSRACILPPFSQPKQAPRAHSSSYSSCGCFSTIWERWERVKGKPRPPRHHRARSQLSAHPVFPRLRLQGTGRALCRRVPGDGGARHLSFALLWQTHRQQDKHVNCQKQGPQLPVTAVPLLELSPEETASTDAHMSPESSLCDSSSSSSFILLPGSKS